MAKRKRRESTDSEHGAKRARAPQAAPHKRGGVHKVKDQHKTGTAYDDWDRRQLLGALQERRGRGIYEKDLKKHEMARRLKEDDEVQAREAAKKAQQLKVQVEELKKRNDQKIEEEKKRKAEKEMRRERGEDVSSDSEPGPARDQTQFGVGEEVSDSSMDKLSPVSTISSPSAIHPLYPYGRLRIGEWSHEEPPLEDPPMSEWSSSGREREDYQGELLPMNLPYVVMKLVTTFSDETLELPGRQHPEKIGQDFVPKLTQFTMNCARNGVLIGTLRKAVIERAEDWAERTIVQYWNGRMYFELPERTSTVPIADVYKKWKTKKEDRRKVPKGTTVKAKTRKQELQQQYKDKRQKLLDVYASSEFRPAICYAPVELDYPRVQRDDEGPRELENLYYIRFPGMDLPHYYFWTRPYEWADPTTPNPTWSSAKIQDEVLEREEAILPYIRSDYKNDKSRPYALDKLKTRVKKKSVPQKFQSSEKRLPKTSKYKAALWAVERQLYRKGLQGTLFKYWQKWVDEGKEPFRKLLWEDLPQLYPSAKMPDAPPVQAYEIPKSIAEKIASIEALSPERPISPIHGDESWTRDDDEYWDVVDAPAQPVLEDDIQDELRRSMSIVHTGRRQSRALSGLLRRFSSLSRWLDGPEAASPIHSESSVESPRSKVVAPARARSLRSASTQYPLPSKKDGKSFRESERHHWEDRFEKYANDWSSLSTPRMRSASSMRRGSSNPHLPPTLTPMPISELQWQIDNLRRPSIEPGEQCRICLDPLNRKDVRSVYQHYQQHHDEAVTRCPFCSWEWGKVDSETKASHIKSHDFDDSLQRRRISSVKPSVFYSVPVPNCRSSQRLSQIVPRPYSRRGSKVTFSPKVVERRIAYNDEDDEDAVDGDVDTLPATSPGPRKSSLKFRNSSRSSSGKRSVEFDSGKRKLRVDTSVVRPYNSNLPDGVRTTKRKRDALLAKLKKDKMARWDALAASFEPLIRSPSPSINVSRKHRRDSDDVWDPQNQDESGSEHIKSPYLPHVVRYSRDDPAGTYDPRKWSVSAADSLEYGTRRRKPRTTKAVQKTKAEVAKSRGKAVGKGSKSKEKESSATSSAVAGQRSRIHKVSAASTSSYRPSKIKKAKSASKGRQTDPTYRDIPISPPSSASKSPLLAKRRKPADVTYRNQVEPESPIETETPAKRRKKTSSTRGTKVPPTLQSAKLKEQDAVHDASRSRARNLAAAVPRRTASQKAATSVQKRKRKFSTASQDPSALHRKPSLFNTGRSEWGDQDFIEFIDTNLLDDYDEDVLTGNPFAAPPKKKRKIDVKRTKTKSSRKSKRDALPTPPTTPLAARRATRKATVTTISGRPFIEPLPLAPAIRMGKSKPVRRPSISMVETPTSATSRTTATDTSGSASRRSLSPGIDWRVSKARGRRSSAPTPSPSLPSITPPKAPKFRTSSTSSRGTRKRASEVTVSSLDTTFPSPPASSVSRSKLPKLLINPRSPGKSLLTGIPAHRNSHSEVGPIVPPNTPAPATFRKKSRAQSTQSFPSARSVGSDLGSELDANALSDKIGKVKTTRGGLVRELPETVVSSVLGKGKARGRSVAKAKGKNGPGISPKPKTKTSAKSKEEKNGKHPKATTKRTKNSPRTRTRNSSALSPSIPTSSPTPAQPRVQRQPRARARAQDVETLESPTTRKRLASRRAPLANAEPDPELVELQPKETPRGAPMRLPPKRTLVNRKVVALVKARAKSEAKAEAKRSLLKVPRTTGTKSVPSNSRKKSGAGSTSMGQKLAPDAEPARRRASARLQGKYGA